MTTAEHCQKCGKTWSQEPGHPRQSCPGCGDGQWKLENSLDNLGRLTEYRIVRERSGRGLVITLELAWVQNETNNAVAALPHRLKSKYRHMKGDLGIKDGRGCVVTFDKLPDGRWDITELRRGEPRSAMTRRMAGKGETSDLRVSLRDPLEPFRAGFTQLRVQAETTMRSLHASSVTQSKSRDAVQRETWGGLGGAVTDELLGIRGIGSRIGRALASDAQRAQRIRNREASRDQARLLVFQARQQVEMCSKVLGHRLAQSLLRALAEAETARNSETTVRGVLRVIARLESWRASPLRTER